MSFEYDGLIVFIAIFIMSFTISLVIFFGLQIVNGEPIPDTKNYKECIEKEVQPFICNMIYPPPNIQGA